MRSTDLIEDFADTQILEFRLELNEHIEKSNLIYEDSNDSKELRDYLKSIGVEPVIGKEFFISAVIWSPGHKFMNIATHKTPIKILAINNNRLEIQLSNGQIKMYPETNGQLVNQTQCSILFNTEQNMLNDILLINVKYSTWKITKKELI